MKLFYFDGWTAEHISFECEIDGETCLVNGQWFDHSRKKGECKIEYLVEIDSVQVDQLIENISPLNERYEVCIDDLGSFGVVFELNGKIVKRVFDTAGEQLYKDFPELKGKLGYLEKFCEKQRMYILNSSNKNKNKRLRHGRAKARPF